MLQRTSQRNRTLDELLYLVWKSDLPLCVIESKAGLANGTLCRWRRNEHGATLAKAIAVGEVLGYELEWKRKEQ